MPLPTQLNSINELVDAVINLPPEELSKTDHASLYTARAHAPADKQNELAGAEHRAFAREATQENLAMALPILLATLAYQPYKVLTGGGRSNASLDQAMQGIAGVGDGVSQRIEQLLRSN
jgi:hypothetical protein